MYLTEQPDSLACVERDMPVITPAMVEAGIYELREQQYGTPFADLVKAIYYAMEYERLDSLTSPS